MEHWGWSYTSYLLLMRLVMSWTTWDGNWRRRSETVLLWASRMVRSAPLSRRVFTTSVFPHRAASWSAVPAEVRTFTSSPEPRSTSTTPLQKQPSNHYTLRSLFERVCRTLAEEHIFTYFTYLWPFRLARWRGVWGIGRTELLRLEYAATNSGWVRTKVSTVSNLKPTKETNY